MALNLLTFSILFFFFFIMKPFPIVESRTKEAYHYSFTKTFQKLRGIKNGQRMRGMIKLKSYLNKFGYLNNYSHNNHFDQNVEVALKEYQAFHHLRATGHMNVETLRKMSLPRCGIPDVVTPYNNLKGLTILANYSFFRGSPRWEESKRALTYRFVSSASVLRMDLVRYAVNNAFQSWSRVSDFTFTEIPFQNSFNFYFNPNPNPNIVIGFHRRDHGDGHPFDGPGEVLAHTFAPQDGRLHFDADESWISDPRGQSIGSGENVGWDWVWGQGWRRRVPSSTNRRIDLETVALHEIGHLLGLGHSSVPESIMYPSYEGVRRYLSQDDKDGIATLYGNQNRT